MHGLLHDFLESHQVLPLFLVDGVLTVAVSEPTNVFLHEEIERVSGKVVQLVAGTAREISATLQTYLPNDQIFVIDRNDDAAHRAFRNIPTVVITEPSQVTTYDVLWSDRVVFTTEQFGQGRRALRRLHAARDTSHHATR